MPTLQAHTVAPPPLLSLQKNLIVLRLSILIPPHTHPPTPSLPPQQTEGAPFVDGRTASVWDTYAAKPGNIQDGTTGAMGTGFYYMYKTDIALMKSLGVKNFRMSISWSRLIPRGRAGSPVNQKAVTFYNNVFDELIKAGISPAVTLFHWDVPQVLQDGYEAFIDPKIQEDFVYYADQAFRLFGGKVKKWTTFNEPWITCNLQVWQWDDG
jgi:beta-glucosidase/6-phospho-beta-glucosidase/beta-galactosidase